MDKVRRLSHIFAKDGKTIIVALDGFGFSKNTDGVDYTVKNLKGLIDHGLDAALVTYGQAKMFEKELVDVTTILRVDGSVNVFDSSVPETTQFFGIRDALKLGAEGVVCMTFPGDPEREEFSHKMLSKLSQEAENWNVPVLAETLPYSYPVTTPESNDPVSISTAARLGAEYGADVVKTRMTGDIETDKKIVANAKRPVVALGGPKTDNETYFEFVKNLMNAGVKGVACGRNITKDPNPVGKVAALNALIHQNSSVKEALEVYNSVK